MQAALYDPRLGYYNTERLKIGPDGDYYTSGNVHPAFGAILARAFVQMCSGLSEPITIVESGAGTGQLAEDILRSMRDEHAGVFDQFGYAIVETSPAMVARQQNRLSRFGQRVRWCDLDELEHAPFSGIGFSNELLDAMPVHRIRFRNGVLEEQYVTLDDRSGLALEWKAPSTGRLVEYIRRVLPAVRELQIVEINLDAVDWLSRMSRALQRGWLVTVDYGDVSERLYTRDRMSGTLRCFHRHRLVDSPLDRVGEQDITASVNFRGLVEYGRDFGFQLGSLERQTAFLTRMGLIERIAASHPANGTLDDLKQRLAIKNLFVPGGVSDSFLVLIQRKETAELAI
jgi:SAM-dependent MidA family methyltransferase